MKTSEQCFIAKLKYSMYSELISLYLVKQTGQLCDETTRVGELRSPNRFKQGADGKVPATCIKTLDDSPLVDVQKISKIPCTKHSLAVKMYLVRHKHTHIVRSPIKSYVRVR